MQLGVEDPLDVDKKMSPVNKVVNVFETNKGRRLRQKQTMKQKHKCNLFITKRVLLFTQQHCKICNVGIQRWNLTPHTLSKFRAHDLLIPKQLRWPLCQGKCFNFLPFANFTSDCFRNCEHPQPLRMSQHQMGLQGMSYRVARFFVLQLSKTGKIYQITLKYTQKP
jgi:hypothetical protein